jgi:hypothetical protein
MKKAQYFAEAERLYIVEQNTINEIASRLKLGEKTVRLWKEEGQWEEKRKQHLAQKESFHEELYGFARFLMSKIKEDMNDNVKVDPGRLYTFARILPLITKVKDYEDIVGKDQSKPAFDKNAVPDSLIDLIRKEVMGEKV